jgi:hypothetical protein
LTYFGTRVLMLYPLMKLYGLLKNPPVKIADGLVHSAVQSAVVTQIDVFEKTAFA